MGTYNEDDKEKDATMLNSLKGIIYADTKRMLSHVVHDKEVDTPLFRMMVIKAGGTLDCFVKINRKEHSATLLTNKRDISRQLLRQKGAIRFMGAEKLGRKEDDTATKTRKLKGGIDFDISDDIIDILINLAISKVPMLKPLKGSLKKILKSFHESIFDTKSSDVGSQPNGKHSKLANDIRKCLDTTNDSGDLDPDENETQLNRAKRIYEKMIETPNGDQNTRWESFIIKEYNCKDDKKSIAEHNKRLNISTVQQCVFGGYFSTYDKEMMKLGHTEYDNIAFLKGNIEYYKVKDKAQRELNKLSKEQIPQKKEKQAKLNRAQYNVDYAERKKHSHLWNFFADKVFKINPADEQDFFYKWGSTLNNGLGVIIVAIMGALIYYCGPAYEYYEAQGLKMINQLDPHYKEEIDDPLIEMDPEEDIDKPLIKMAPAKKVDTTPIHPLMQFIQRGEKSCSTLKTYFRKHPMFTVGFTTAALFTAYGYRKHIHNKNLFNMLLGMTKAPPDEVHKMSYAGESYADTGECLRSVDPKLHKVFLKYDAYDTPHALSSIQYHVVCAQYKRRQSMLINDRAILNAHLIRTDGTVRDSIGEVARAIAYHWKMSDLLSIGWTQTKRTFRFRWWKKHKSKRRSTTGSSGTSTKKLKKKKGKKKNTQRAHA